MKAGLMAPRMGVAGPGGKTGSAAAAVALEGQVEDLLDEPGVVHAGGRRCHGELAGPLEVAAGVDLQDVDLAGLGEPDVHPPVVPDPEGPVGVHRDLLQPG